MYCSNKKMCSQQEAAESAGETLVQVELQVSRKLLRQILADPCVRFLKWTYKRDLLCFGLEAFQIRDFHIWIGQKELLRGKRSSNAG
jgi:hypothetical protein